MLLTMCGIVGYVGSKQALGIVIEGLRRMEYRGYDSAGIAVVERADGEARLAGAKKAGKLANLEKELDARPLPASTTGLGHTRWATHGGPTDGNAHPHFSAPAEGVYTDTTGKVAVIHNGIIENFARLKAELTAGGVEFLSETDTEVVAHLLARDFAEAGDGDLGAAMRRVVNRLQGAFTLVAVHAEAPDVVVGARRNSPLVIGVGEGEASRRSSRTPARPSRWARTRSPRCSGTAR
jgi:glutamine---fructose-6-phosphate transaminase (isomerizing)